MNNLISELSKFYLKKRKYINIFGRQNYTKDGTCVRDFIDIRDLSEGHVKSLNKLRNSKSYNVFNLGSGKETTVFKLIKVFSKTAKIQLNIRLKLKYVGKNDLFGPWAHGLRP